MNTKFLVALAAAAFAADMTASAQLTSVDLSSYARVGRYDLPTAANTPGATNQLALEASAVTYNRDTGTLFLVGDEGTGVVQVSKTGQLINSMNLTPGVRAQGTSFDDTEGLTYAGNGQFVLTEERYRQLDLFTYAPGTTLTNANVQKVKLGTTIGNVGLEGVSYDRATGGYILVKETGPQGIFQTTANFATGTASNGSPTTVNSVNLFAPALINLLDLADVYALSNLTALDGLTDSSHLILLSQESGKLVEVDRQGNIFSSLTLVGDADNPLSIVEQGNEGVTFDELGNMYVVNEGGGGANRPQLWVYAPVPEPGTWVLLTLGFSALGISAARRRRGNGIPAA